VTNLQNYITKDGSNLEQEGNVICLSSDEEQVSDEEKVDHPPQKAIPVISVPSAFEFLNTR